MTSEHTPRNPHRPAHARIFNLRALVILALVIGVIGTAGCRTSPIRNYNSQPVPAGATMAEVGKAIQDAGNSLGWAMKEEYPGMISGELFIRDHTAVVEIPYSTTSYSIRYKSSKNLKYDAAKKTIHSNYNGWVENLDNGIRTRLARL
jgi:predicted small secreted protein